MSKDIFGFWSRISDDAFVHPEDQGVFDRVSHNFQLDSLPAAYFGPLHDAPVVLLFLSPGYSEFDAPYSRTAKGRANESAQRKGTAKLPSAEEHGPRNKWAARVIKQFDYDIADVADRIAFLNIGAYHSKRFRDRNMLAALTSSRIALEWAQSVLFPQAEAGNRTVVCLRSPGWWGLEKGKCYGEALFAPACNRAGIMRHDSIRKHVRKAVHTALEKTRSR